ncbi:MAG: PAS domain S-box protein, partial [Acidimicrobiia bacterium]|nr:PAS domain S-box protein [Acidimicrobiia bacterium]
MVSGHDEGNTGGAEALPPGDTEEFHRLVIEAKSEGVVVQDPAGHIVFANTAARRTLGWTIDAMRKASGAGAHWGLLHLDGMPWLAEEQPSSEALRTGRTVRDALMGFERETGGRCWISVTATPMVRGTGDLGGVVVTFDDVTDKREAELARRESEERFRSAVDSMLDAYMIVRPVREGDRIVDFVFEFVNGGAEANIGLRPDELVGQRMLEVAPNLATRGAFGRCVKAVETGVPLVMDVPWFDGPLAHGAFEVRGVPVGDGLALTIRNVTERRLGDVAASQGRRTGREPTDAAVPQAMAEADEDAPRLTARALEVLALLGRGVSTRGISERLFISLNTARNHVQRTIAKLGAHSRLEAVAIARR